MVKSESFLTVYKIPVQLVLNFRYMPDIQNMKINTKNKVYVHM